MRETDFIERNKDKWGRYEETLGRTDQDPALLGELFVHTTDDLSISRTFYPNRSVRVYLNGLAQRAFLQLYRGRRGDLRSFLDFWADGLPRAVYASRPYLLLSLAIFLLAVVIGIISYRIDPAFAETILGADYVRMTEANIAGGDPMAVYRSRDASAAALHITLNNLLVALLTFAAGAFLGVGTVVMLIRTGVMVGVFQYFFYAQGDYAGLGAEAAAAGWMEGLSWLFTAGGSGLRSVLASVWYVAADAEVLRESLLTIWVHGALEISSFVIAGGAGLTLGSGLLFPGTYTRLEAFGRSARAGARILLGTVPLFVIAGLLEGFVTRQSELPEVLRLLFIGCCFLFIVWYYVVYPRSVARRPPPPARYRVPEEIRRAAPIAAGNIRSLGAQLRDTFAICRRGMGELLAGSATLSLLYCLFSFLFGPDPAKRYRFGGYVFAELENFHQLTSSVGLGRDWTFSVLVALGFYGLFRLGIRTAVRHTDLHPPAPGWRGEVRLLAVSALLALTFAFGGREVALLTFLTLPFLVMAGVGTYTADLGAGRLFRMVYTNLGYSYGILLLLLLIVLPAGFILDSVVGRYFFAFFDWVIYTDGSTIDARNVMLQAFCYYFAFGLLFCGWVITFTLSLGSLREIKHATGLKERIAGMGNARKGNGPAR